MDDPYLIDHHKIHLHPQRVAQWLDAGTDWEKLKKIYPLYVEIAPCGACSHRCLFCAVDYIGYKSVYLDPKAIRHCLSDMGNHGVKSVMYAGEGEPLLNKDLPAIISWTKKCGIDVAITTNAVAMTEKFCQQALADITWLKASVNAGNSETYAKVHQTKEADFDRVITNLGRATHLRRENGWKTTLGTQMVLLPENRDTAIDLCKISKSIGLDYLVIKPYSQHPSSETTAQRYGDLQYNEPPEFGARLRQFNSDSFKVVYRERTMATLTESDRAYSKCQATPMFWAYIMANGDVYGCGAHLLNELFKYGNINEQSFSEIWEGERRRRSVEFVRDELDISTCRKNCRMEHVNRFLWELKNPKEHVNFI